ncbi:Aste57867_8340 [Aphanomyces stellatus]|uniref:Aste57867_8340 protein n=1 Tax=Aphanomyces stellatus TaxID=120398 RepID=A0A485KK38_9STRA|nr:hypothetical protein As57867_008308 [Aphanomyces stellatus]VFT85227.1 Aste57867_8340 [Aphanomyces stellatus]
MQLEMAMLEFKWDVTFGLVEASDVAVPTSFVVLPCKSLSEDNVDATKVTSFVAQLWNTGKTLQSIKGSSYLYLIDEATESVVVPDEKDSIYPIAIPTRDANSFLLMNLPLIQSTFKSFKKASTATGWLQRLHVLSKSPNHKIGAEKKKDWTKEVERAIADLSEPSVSFQVLEEALNEPAAFVRGAALRELKRFFNEHDTRHSFGGLMRVISNQGRVIWTTEARVLAMDMQADELATTTIKNIQQKLNQSMP